MNKSENARLVLPINITYLPAIQGFVGELAKTAGLPPRDIDFLQLAVEEAITNVIEHGLFTR